MREARISTAAVRTPSKAENIRSESAEIVEVDYARPATLAAALTNVEKVFLVQGSGPTLLAEGKAIVDACAAAGVRSIVKLSALGTQHPARLIFGAEHLEIEHHIRSKGIALTSLRPSSFYANMPAFDAGAIKGTGAFYNMVATARMNWVSTEDIGTAAAVCLTSAGHAGAEYYLCGPDCITMAELAAKYSRAFGREVRHQPIDEAALRHALAGFHMPPVMIDGMVNLYEYFAAGGYDYTTSDMRMLTGKPGQSIDEFLALPETRAAFV